MIASRVTDFSSIFSTLGLLTIAFIGLSNNKKIARANQKIDAVHGEVKTLNSLSLANLADAAEGRRITDLPQDTRTSEENEFMDQAATHDQSSRSKA